MKFEPFAALADELSHALDNLKIFQNESTVNLFYTNVTNHFENLPDLLQQSTSRTVDMLKCFFCKSLLISSVLKCGHGVCSNCFQITQTCPCTAPEKNSKKCGKCQNTVDPTDCSCIHYCNYCIKTLISSRTNCDICAKPFQVIKFEGTCTKCKIFSNILYKVCETHYHCISCCYIDLQKLQCAECSYILNEIIAAKLFCEIHPKCENCKKRKKKENIWLSPCCGKTYCFMCMSEFLFQKCFCNAGLSQEIQGYLGEFRKGMNKYLGLFEVVISKI